MLAQVPLNSAMESRLTKVPTLSQMETAILASKQGTFTRGGFVDDRSELPSTANDFTVWHIHGEEVNVYAFNHEGEIEWIPFAPTLDLTAYSTTADMNAAIETALNAAKSYANERTAANLSGVMHKPSILPTANNIVLFDAYGNASDSGKKISDMMIQAAPAEIPGVATSYINFSNQPIGGLDHMGITSNSPVYYVMRKVPSGTLTADQAVGAYGRVSFLGLTPVNAAMSDMVFLRAQDAYINRSSMIYGGGKNGFQTLSLVEGIFCKDGQSNEYMVLRATSNNSDGLVGFSGWSLGKFIETTPIEVLNSVDFSAKYTIIQDSNPSGQDTVFNVGYSQLTGKYWVNQSGTMKRVFRATFRGRLVNGETTWITLNNVSSFLGFDGAFSSIRDTSGTVYPINYSDPGYLNINTKWLGNTKMVTKINVLDGNTTPWNIASGTNNALVTFYYTRTDA
jgi:hypothetical protein